MKPVRILSYLILIVVVVLIVVYAKKTPPSAAPMPTPPPSAFLQKPPVVVEIKDAPQTLKAGVVSTFTWEIKALEPATVMHTAIHYGAVQHAGEFATTTGPKLAGYPSMTKDFDGKESQIPGTFTVKITPTRKEIGSLFMRAHVVIAGKNFWSPEVEVKVTK